MLQASTRAQTELQSLLRAAKSLEAAWQSKSGDEFLIDATEVIRRLQMQYELLMVLAERVDREALEWEQADHNGAMAFRASNTHFVQALPISIFSGGPGVPSRFTSAVIPLFAGLSIGTLQGKLPGWLNSLLERFFPPTEIISPIAEGSASPQQTPSTTFGDLLKENPHQDTAPAASPSAEIPSQQPAPPSAKEGYDIYYDIPVQSQGALYGSAACLPTSLSMITGYYHARDSANQAISPEGLRNMLDPGDGTEGRGVTLDKLNDDLNELGYTNVRNFQSDMDGLRKELSDGPVVANIGVKLVSSPSRALDGPGATNHSVVVRAVSANGVLINDPWSGSEIQLTQEQFSSMWSKGDHWLQTVRP
jgi:predicted double-glycine peptidase